MNTTKHHSQRSNLTTAARMAYERLEHKAQILQEHELLMPQQPLAREREQEE